MSDQHWLNFDELEQLAQKKLPKMVSHLFVSVHTLLVARLLSDPLSFSAAKLLAWRRSHCQETLSKEYDQLPHTKD